MKSRRGYMQRFYSPMFAAPALLIFFLFFMTPVVLGFAYSFTDWNQYLDEANFIDLDNFRRIFTDKVSLLALKNTFIFAFVSTVGKNILGLDLALVLNSRVRGKNFWRALYFCPCIQHHCGGADFLHGAAPRRPV